MLIPSRASRASSAQRHRSNLEIMYTILRYVAVEGKAKKTHILYHASLNSRSLERFLQKLVDSRFLELVEGDRGTLYAITMRGRRALKVMARLMELLEPGLHVKSVDISRVLGGSGIDVRSPGRILGHSGILHSFDFAFEKGRGKVVASIVEVQASPDEAMDSVCRFIVGVIDSRVRGILFVPTHMVAWARSLVSSLSTARLNVAVDVVGYNDEQSLVRALRTSLMSIPDR